MKKRNKRSNAHDMMDIIFKQVVHALRLSGIKIPKNVLLPSQLPVSVNSSEEEDVHGSEEEDAHDREEEHAHDSEEDACGREKDHWNANGDEANQVHNDSRSPMLDTIDKLTEPTACSLLDGIGINVELVLVKVFPFQKACHSVPVQDGYVVMQPTYVWANAGHYPLPVPIDNSRRSPGKLHLSSSCNMRISNRQNSIHCNRRRSPSDLPCRRGTRPGNLCLKMRFLTVLLGQNRNAKIQALDQCCACGC
jgi:hypothetical protein